ncbi:MAG: NRDE family protein [Sphingopyxis sp.]|nr:NRDE family protein [Sphingopyxis sp.]
MCVVALAHRVHPEWPLILLGNRDEFHARPAAPLHAWDDGSGIVAGRDLQAGGTWLGVQPERRRIVVVTNVRGAPPDPAKESRGALVVDMLRGDGRFADPVESDLDRFNAFNLFSVAGDEARLLSNRPAPHIDALGGGIHALANEPVDTPCPRADRLADILRRQVKKPDPDFGALMAALTDSDAPALFLPGEVYGTRCSTLVAVGRTGQVLMMERRYDARGRTTGRTSLTSDWGG